MMYNYEDDTVKLVDGSTISRNRNPHASSLFATVGAIVMVLVMMMMTMPSAFCILVFLR